MNRPADRSEALLDVPISVSAIVGSARRALRDVLEFNLGAVIELETPNDAPIDLYVHGTLVARGQIVLVDKSFGIQITEVQSRPADSNDSAAPLSLT